MQKKTHASLACNMRYRHALILTPTRPSTHPQLAQLTQLSLGSATEHPEYTNTYITHHHAQKRGKDIKIYHRK